MKNVLMSLAAVLLFCAFTPRLVKRKHNRFVIVAEYLINHKLKILTEETVKDIYVKKLMHELKVDVVADGNNGCQYFHEPVDSVVVFVNHGSFFSWKYKKVLYDYAKTHRHFADTSIVHNDYQFKKVSERFYISSEKTDR